MVPDFVLGTGAGAVYARHLGRGAIGDVEYSYTWSSTGGGFTSAAFSLLLPENFDHGSLRNGSPVRMQAGGYTMGRGRIADIDRDNWRVTVAGDCQRASRFNAEAAKLDPGDAAGPPTTNPRVAVVQANLRGLGWNGYGNLPDLTLAEDTTDRAGYVSIESLLNRWCEVTGQRWGLTNDNAPYLAADPTAVRLNLRPGVPGLPTADEDYITRLVVTYVSELTIPVDGGTPVPSKWETAMVETDDAPRGQFEDTADITDLGLLVPNTTTDFTNGVPGTYPAGNVGDAASIALQYARAMLDARSARMRFTAGVQGLQRWQVATNGNTEAALWMPMAGKRVRQYGMLADSGAMAHGRTLEWVVGKSIHYPEQRTVTLDPVDIAPRSLPDIIAAVPTSEGGTGRATIKLGG